jgi:hypothetical protein
VPVVPRLLPRLAVRAFLLAAALVVASLGSAGSVAAASAASSGAHGGGGGGGSHGGGGGGGSSTVGYDISYPQCGAAYPSNPAFGIVGVNDGIVFSANPCLADEIAWAGGAAAQLYANTGNPGPLLSHHWPDGQVSPAYCDPLADDSSACAYDYGWNAATDSLQDAADAYSTLGLTDVPASAVWWLDVETSNSWRTDTALNISALQGAVDALASAGATRIGFYSTTVQWGEITGGTQVFAPHPSWGAGAPSLHIARSDCSSIPGFTGGALTIVQYPSSGFDADLVC